MKTRRVIPCLKPVLQSGRSWRINHSSVHHQMLIACTNSAFVSTIWSILYGNPALKLEPSPIGHGWELVGGYCRPVRHKRPAFPMHLPAPSPWRERGEWEWGGWDEWGRWWFSGEEVRNIPQTLMFQNLVRQDAVIPWCHILLQIQLWNQTAAIFDFWDKYVMISNLCHKWQYHGQFT